MNRRLFLTVAAAGLGLAACSTSPALQLANVVPGQCGIVEEL